MAHASSIEDIELTDEDEEVDITNTDLAPPTSIPDDGGKDAKLTTELDLMKSANLIKVKTGKFIWSATTLLLHNFTLTIFLPSYILFLLLICSGTAPSNERRGRSA